MVPLCSRKLREEMCKHLAKGSYLSEAAIACGISPKTAMTWMRKGLSDKPEDARYRLFRKAVNQAKGQAATNLVSIIHDAAGEDWKAAMALLSSRYPKQWGRRPRTVVIQSNSNMIGQDMPQEELNRQLLELLRSQEIIKGLPPQEQKLLLQLAKDLPTEQQEVIDAEFSDTDEGSADDGPELHSQGLDEEREGPEDGSPMAQPG